MNEGAVLGERERPNPERYGHQRQVIVEIEGYAWVVSFITDGDTIFFKAMYPSRRANREFQKRLTWATPIRARSTGGI